MLGLTLIAFSKMSRTAASLPPMYLLSMSDPLTLKYFIMNSSATDSPRAVLPVPELPYSRIPLDSLMGNFLYIALYLSGFYTMLRMACLAYLTPASVEKLRVAYCLVLPYSLWPVNKYLENSPNDIDYELVTICYIFYLSVS